jgi:hypothetical protein
MTYLEIALPHLIALSLPLWLFIEEIVHEQARERTAIAVRDERRRVAASREALARKAVSSRRAS